MNNNTYKTTDFKLAVVLSMTFNLVELTKRGTQGTFVFDKSPELDKFISGYYNKELQVEPQAHDDARTNLKSRLYSQIKEVLE